MPLARLEPTTYLTNASSEGYAKSSLNDEILVVVLVIANDQMTGNPQGFAFISFTDASALNKALADTHTILGRMWLELVLGDGGSIRLKMILEKSTSKK
ncbi:RNA-binding protein 1, partial [Tanacetum coccineum]